ncbi:MAG: hypothetical protein ABI670_02700 [Chloroflexota bacterium]
MHIPTYFERRPSMDLSADTIASFERLYAEAVEHGTGAEIDYRLSAPKWQFLCYMADTRGILLHGSGNPDITEFEPRQSNDTHEFGNRKAVYAASDGLWAMYFAIVDRDRHVNSLINSCFRVLDSDKKPGDPIYFFSINDDALPHRPWRNGMIYLLPSATFEQQPLDDYKGVDAEIAQWASLVPVKPLAKLAIVPDDFPFLSRIRGHNLKEVMERATANPDGFPWVDEPRDPANTATT